MKKLSRTCAAWLVMAAAPAMSRAQHDMAHMRADSGVRLPLGVPWTRVTSGTAWLPDDSPMYALGGTRGAWMWMVHGAAFGQYNAQATFRGDTQIGLVDWEMAMAARSLAGGVLRANLMTSLQSLVLGERGYPQLLQTGGSLKGFRLVDRQHPHPLVGEAAATYERPLTNRVAVSLYAAAIGEPAVGPVVYMHGPSAWDDPLAPIAHHSQDATDAAHGVATLGVYTRWLKVEGSAFNAREATDRFAMDFGGARLDSYSARVSVAAGRRVVASAWAAYLFAHDPLEDPIGMQRYGGSLLHVVRTSDGRAWSNALIAGVDVHHHGSRHHNHTDSSAKTYNFMRSYSLESAWDATARTTIFARVEQTAKSADDLGFFGGDLSQSFTVRAISLGASRALLTGRYAALSVGARATLNVLPAELRGVYRTTTPGGAAVFLRVRPGAASL